MNHFLSNYRKDYQWPNVKTNAPIFAENHSTISQQVPCTCGTEAASYMASKNYSPIEAGSYNWRRQRPTNSSFNSNPDINTIIPVPDFKFREVKQSATYLQKLQEKYSHLFNNLQIFPPEMIHRVDLDRLKTTYQAEYSNLGEHLWLNVNKSTSPEHQTCPLKDNQSKLQTELQDLGKFQRKQFANTVENEHSKSYLRKENMTRGSKKNEEDVPDIFAAPLVWKSEYQDTVGDTGQTIIKEKLHHYSKLSGRRKLLARF